MTEQEWLASEEPQAMLRFVHENPDHDNIVCCRSDRKLRLFACACMRLTGERPKYGPDWLAAWEVDGQPMDAEPAGQPLVAARNWASPGPRTPASADIAALLREIVGNPFKPVTLPVETIRELLPNPVVMDASGHKGPFYGTRQVCPWLTPTVLALAQAAYQERPGKKCIRCDGAGNRPNGYCLENPNCLNCRGTGRIEDGTLDNDRLAVLADALEEAGCPGEEECPCPHCHQYNDDPGNPWGPGSHPERDPASGRHEGGWTNCKTCNSGGRQMMRAGIIRVSNPVLMHLRGYKLTHAGSYIRSMAYPILHCRGCWVLDLILGKE